jgi:hypothetical protein
LGLKEFVVDDAKAMRFRDFWRAVRYWEQLADPDGAEDEAEQERSQRALYFAQSFRGTWLGKMTFDPIGGTIVNNELERLEQQLFDADWAEARPRLGDKATPAPHAERCSFGTESASTTSATSPPRTAKSITSFPTRPAARPRWTMAGRPADSTIASDTESLVSECLLTRWATRPASEQTPRSKHGRSDVPARCALSPG